MARAVEERGSGGWRALDVGRGNGVAPTVMLWAGGEDSERGNELLNIRTCLVARHLCQKDLKLLFSFLDRNHGG
jgi:hypothetical protein